MDLAWIFAAQVRPPSLPHVSIPWSASVRATKLRIVAKGHFGLPSLGWDQPFSLKTISPSPPGAITDDTIRSDYWLKPGIPMAFDNRRTCEIAA